MMAKKTKRWRGPPKTWAGSPLFTERDVDRAAARALERRAKAQATVNAIVFLTLDDARRLSLGMADLLCWCAGFHGDGVLRKIVTLGRLLWVVPVPRLIRGD